MPYLNKKNIHLIGIGGIGMSSLAHILLDQGFRVSGSDLKRTPITEKLQQQGAQVFTGHFPSNIKDAEVLIYSAAVKQDNPELAAGRSKELPVLTRGEAVAVLANQKRLIAVTGAHGKTTTASLIAHLFLESGLKPTVSVGGELFSLNGNAFSGAGDYFVLEADESDGTFLNLTPLYSVVTNIDREHLDYYRDLEQISAAFQRFMFNTKAGGRIFFCVDNPQLNKMARSLDKRKFSYGLSPQAQLFAQDLTWQGHLSFFNCVYNGQVLGELALPLPGQHNVCNALAAVALGLELGLGFKTIQQALGSYRGVRRRLELKLRTKDVLIFDDYAHHPTEIKATLAALKNFPHQRLVAVFQPHRYTRTKFLIDDFGRCFRDADYLIVTDIYPANEAAVEGVSGESISQAVQQQESKSEIRTVRFLSQQEIISHLLQEIRPGDLVAIMGAGDIGGISDVLAKEIKGAPAV